MIKAYNIDPSTVVIGTGKTYYAKERRFIFDAVNRKEILELTAKYAIKYFDKEKIYILWKVREQTTKKRYVYRNKFSIDADLVLSCIGQTEELRKGVEYQWRMKETVRIFDRTGIEYYIAQTLLNE